MHTRTRRNDCFASVLGADKKDMLLMILSARVCDSTLSCLTENVPAVRGILHLIQRVSQQQESAGNQYPNKIIWHKQHHDHTDTNPKQDKSSQLFWCSVTHKKSPALSYDTAGDFMIQQIIFFQITYISSKILSGFSLPPYPAYLSFLLQLPFLPLFWQRPLPDSSFHPFFS